ncbi:hypothetical protein [Chelatococcus reniformis]|uniref:hypothetical protein n=1 Tax=Chelatococcus reniformis TaxID=1494448 RepID=UPI0016634B16|nr:hypothetical protein [Chelatococcus reniformis]
MAEGTELIQAERLAKSMVDAAPVIFEGTYVSTKTIKFRGGYIFVSRFSVDRAHKGRIPNHVSVLEAYCMLGDCDIDAGRRSAKAWGATQGGRLNFLIEADPRLPEKLRNAREWPVVGVRSACGLVVDASIAANPPTNCTEEVYCRRRQLAHDALLHELELLNPSTAIPPIAVPQSEP